MTDQPSPSTQTTDTNRRNFLKTTGLALGAGLSSLGVTARGASAKESVSADMVDSENPKTAENFVTKSLDLGETKAVTTAYSNLSDEQLQAVRDAIDRLSEYTLEVTENPTTEDVSAMGIPISKTATLTKTISGITVHQTTHTLDYQVDTAGETLSDADSSSTGSAPASLWHHKGLYSTFLQVQDNSSNVYSTRSHEYTHSVGGQVIVHEAAVIDIHGTASGSFDVTKNIVGL